MSGVDAKSRATTGAEVGTAPPRAGTGDLNTVPPGAAIDLLGTQLAGATPVDTASPAGWMSVQGDARVPSEEDRGIMARYFETGNPAHLAKIHVPWQVDCKGIHANYRAYCALLDLPSHTDSPVCKVVCGELGIAPESGFLTPSGVVDLACQKILAMNVTLRRRWAARAAYRVTCTGLGIAPTAPVLCPADVATMATASITENNRVMRRRWAAPADKPASGVASGPCQIPVVSSPFAVLEDPSVGAGAARVAAVAAVAPVPVVSGPPASATAAGSAPAGVAR